ncbi:CST complex subunit Ten1 [Daldinia bambusicola]|nr:CST complex subunit Ten1 [Daldinia bambusicola]
MSHGPLPSVRCLLSHLSTKHVGDKVRFLGCVTGYSTRSATLSLEHEYPKGTKARVSVDVTLLLENLNSEQTDIGQWVHIIGYITSIDKSLVKTTAGSNTENIGVQALVLWISRDLDISSYESSSISEIE